jgi:hypothetical protein
MKTGIDLGLENGWESALTDPSSVQAKRLQLARQRAFSPWRIDRIWAYKFNARILAPLSAILHRLFTRKKMIFRIS